MGRHAQNRKLHQVDNHGATFPLPIQWFRQAIIKYVSSLKENWERSEKVFKHKGC